MADQLPSILSKRHKTVDAHYKLHAELLTIPDDITANVVGTLHIETAPYAPMANLCEPPARCCSESGF